MEKRIAESQKLLARRWLRRHLRRLVTALQGVPSAEDPESIHQVRVACRRLRAGFQVFAEAIGPELADRWRRSLRRLARKLGEARDLDVQIQTTTEQLAGVCDVTLVPGVAFWLSRLERRRARLQTSVCEAVRRFQRESTSREIRRWCRSQIVPSPMDITATGDPEYSLTEQQESLLRLRLTEFLQSGEALRHPDDQSGHHNFRIMGKKLRYSLEALLPVLGTASEVALEALRQIQEYAGQIHDCDVRAASLAELIQRIENGQRVRPRWLNPKRALPGLRFLAEHYLGLRKNLFIQLVEFWQQDKLQQLWRFLVEDGFRADGRKPEKPTRQEASEGSVS